MRLGLPDRRPPPPVAAQRLGDLVAADALAVELVLLGVDPARGGQQPDGPLSSRASSLFILS